MKRQLASLVVAATVISGSMVTPIALNNVQAATVQQKQTVFTEKALVNGKFIDVHYTVVSKTKLYSTTDLAKFLSAGVVHNQKSSSFTFTKTSGKTKLSLNMQAKSTNAVVNGKKVKLAKAPLIVGRSLFAEPTAFIKSLGGDALVDSNLFISSNSPIKFGTEKINVDGQLQTFKTISYSGKQWYSANDFAKFTASTIKTDKTNQVFLVKNGTSKKIGLNPVNVKGNVYADMNELVKSLGGDLLAQQTGKFISVAGLLSGDSGNPQWLNDSTLLVKNSDADGSYIVDVKSKKSLFKIDATDVVVSPDGKSAIYSDEDSYLYLVNLVTKNVSVLNDTDSNPKFNFIWSNDGTKVYFIQGSKMEGIGSVNLSDGKITSIFTDSLSSKADLTFSPDGTKLLYTVGKEGTTSYTDKDNSDVSDIDVTNTENQVYLLDLKAEKKAGQKLTSTTDNKVFPAFLTNETIVYTGYETDDSKLPTMYLIDTKADNKISPLLVEKDIVSATVTAQGKLYIVMTEKNGEQSIYTVDTATKQLTKVTQTKLSVSALSYSANGKMLAVTVEGENGEQVFVYNNGQFEALTK